MGRKVSNEASVPSPFEEAQKLVEQCTDDCDRCPVRTKCRALWDEYACNMNTGKGKYTLQGFQRRFGQIKREKSASTRVVG